MLSDLELPVFLTRFASLPFFLSVPFFGSPCLSFDRPFPLSSTSSLVLSCYSLFFFLYVRMSVSFFLFEVAVAITSWLSQTTSSGGDDH